MSNVLTNILPKILARALLTLRERAVMPRLVNSDYSRDAARKGATIDIPIPTAVGIIDVTPGPTPPAPTDTTPDLVQVQLNNWKQNEPFFLTDKELTEIDANEHFVPGQMDEAVKALANTVNESIFARFKDVDQGVFGVFGAAGVTPFSTVSDATGARKILNQQLCPKTDRRGVLNFDAGAAALDLSPFSDAEKIGDSGVKIQGEIGRKYGIDWVEDDAVPTHIAGTIIDGGSLRTCAVNNGPGYAVGVSAINVDEGAATTAVGTITRGDIISFAGHSQTYCVIDNTSSGQFAAPDYTFSGNAIAGLTFFPALVASVADDELCTVEPTHVVNLVFHRDAFAYATRPLLDATRMMTNRRNMLSMTDPVTGLNLRLEMVEEHKQTAWEFDILWGDKLVRPELAVRLFG